MKGSKKLEETATEEARDMEMIMAIEMLSLTDAAKFLRIPDPHDKGKETVKNLCLRNQFPLPYFALGRHAEDNIYIYKRHLIDWLEDENNTNRKGDKSDAYSWNEYKKSK